MIVRQFPFVSTLQRMTVIVANPSQHQNGNDESATTNTYHVYTKGAPERIIGMCVQSSVAADFMRHVNHYAKRGYRIIAIAGRSIDENEKYAVKIIVTCNNI